MFETLENGRYLTVAGTELPKYKSKTILGDAFSKVAMFVKRPEIVLSYGALFAAASAMPTDLLSLGKSAVVILSANIITNIALDSEHSGGFRKPIVYFDKEGDKSATAPEDIRSSMVHSLMDATIVGVVASLSVKYGDVSSFDGVTTLIAANTISMGFALSAARFARVAIGDWALIGDPPELKDKPPKISKTETAMSYAPIPALVKV